LSKRERKRRPSKNLGRHSLSTKKSRRIRKKWSWGKAGSYKGFWCDSSWELAYLVYHLDHGIEIKRNSKGFVYTYYGKKHRFYPDFIVNGEYVEIKGKLDRKSKAKIRQFPRPLTIIGKKEIEPFLKYAKKHMATTSPKFIQKEVSKNELADRPCRMSNRWGKAAFHGNA